MKQKWNEEWFRGKREELKAGGGPLPRPMSPTMEMVGIRPENKNYLVGTRHLLPVQSRLVLQLVQAMVDSTRDTVFMPQVGKKKLSNISELQCSEGSWLN